MAPFFWTTVAVEARNVGIIALYHDVITTVEPLVAQNGNRLEVDCDANFGAMCADMVKVRQTLLNLLSNASKFTDPGAVWCGVVACGARIFRGA